MELVQLTAGLPSPGMPLRCVKMEDMTTGTHYLSVACNGCRSFFRRSIAFNRSYNCKGMSFDQHECFHRYRCKKCRLELCLSLGMNPGAVHKESRKDEGDARGYAEAVILPEPLLIECKMDKIMLNLLIMEDAHDRLRTSSYCPQFVEGLTLDEFHFGPSKLSPFRAQAYEPAAYNLITTEVIIKYKICMDMSKFDYSTKKLWMFQDVVYSIEYIKALPIYHLLDDCSQHSDRTYYPDGGTMSWSSDMLVAVVAIQNTSTSSWFNASSYGNNCIHKRMLDGLAPNGIVLIQHEKERYTKALLSYVLARHGIKEGPSIFAKGLSIIDVITKLTSWQKGQHILLIALGLDKHRVPFAEAINHSLA